MRKSFCKKLTAVIFVLLLVVETCVLPVAAISQQVISEKQPETDAGLSEQSFETQCAVLNVWNTGYNAEITLTNTGTKTIHNWMLEFQTDDKITDLWNGSIHYQEANIYRIKNAGWNQDIKPGCFITIGYTAQCGEEIKEPQEYRILSFQEQAQENLYEINAVITDAWETGYIMQVSVENLSEAPIEHWQLTFDFEKQIKNLWNAEVEAHSDNGYSIHNTSDNANINIGEKIWFGFEVVTQNYEQSFPQNIKLDKTCFESDTENRDYLDALYAYYGIDRNIEDNDKDGISDIIEMTVLGLHPAMADSDENGILDGDEDYDEDGLSNLLEIELKTDPANADSDYDGLTDGEEQNIYFTNPLEEDTDKDTLTDYEEVQLGTNPLEADEEKFFTQELPQENIDLDSTEEGLLMPTVTMDMAGYISSHVYVSEAEQDVFLSNRSIMGKPIVLYNDNDAGSKNATLTFDISQLEESLGSNNMKNMVICKLDGYVPKPEDSEEDEINKDEKETENYAYVPLDTSYSWEDSSISASIDGSGVYMVVNELEFLNSLGLDFLSPAEAEPDLTMGQADVVFVVDTTTSMSNIIHQVAANIIHLTETLEKEHHLQINFALIEYKDIKENGENSTQIHKNGESAWYLDAAKFAQEVKWLQAWGGGDYPESMVDALGMAATLDYRENAEKFVIAVTDDDYKIENRYGYESLEEVVQTLHDAGIITSVVAPSKVEETYSCMIDEGGVFCDIDEDFSKELEALISIIAAAVNDGTWYLLDTYDYVKLDRAYEELGDVDSDGDGLTDAKELGTLSGADFSGFANNLLSHYRGNLSAAQIQNIANAIDNGYFFKNVYMAISNPKMEDTDMDGIPDSKDAKPRSSVQPARLCHKNFRLHSGVTDVASKKSATIAYNISYDLNFADFFGDNKKYNQRLCKASSVFAGLAYDAGSGESSTAADDYYCISYDKSSSTKRITGAMSRHGFKNIVTYNIGSDTHQTKCYIGIKNVASGKWKKQVVAVIIKGTNGTAAQWSSNFNIGMGLKKGIDADEDWGDVSNHKGFSIAANRVYDKVASYVEDYRDKDIGLVYWVTGHSRGAAIANLLSARLVDDNNKVFAYTFATPNTTTNSSRAFSKYDCIFNTVNARDFVPTVPCTAWGFGRYGKTANITMDSSMKKTWKIRMKGAYKIFKEMANYNEMSEKSLKKLVNALAGITEDRESIYEYGDEEQVLKEKKKKDLFDAKGNVLPQFMPKTMYEEMEKVKGYEVVSSKDVNNYQVKQSPMFFMQLVAATMPGDNELDNNRIKKTSFMWYKVASKYKHAKTELEKAILLKGISHAHYADSYIIIANRAKAANYK